MPDDSSAAYKSSAWVMARVTFCDKPGGSTAGDVPFNTINVVVVVTFAAGAPSKASAAKITRQFKTRINKNTNVMSI